LQQTPSTQWPEPHALSVLHAAPNPCCAVQFPLSHQAPAAHCSSAVQPEAQAAEVPEQRAGKQPVEPTSEAVRSVQVPAVSGEDGLAKQVSHGPSQAVLQQTPSAQNPLVHSLPEAQAAPVALMAWQVPAEQVPEAHSPFPAQGCPLARRGAQVPVSQNAVSLQSAEVEQEIRHAPAPSQRASPHSPKSVAEAGTGLQEPSIAGTLHATQSPVHALPQHTPSTHASEPAQPSVEAQGWPAAPLGVQRLLLQKKPDAHWALEVHAVGQSDEPPQR